MLPDFVHVENKGMHIAIKALDLAHLLLPGRIKHDDHLSSHSSKMHPFSAYIGRSLSSSSVYKWTDVRHPRPLLSTRLVITTHPPLHI
jgi:hypothetical protein